MKADENTNTTDISLILNGNEVTFAVPVRMHAADFIRQVAGLTGTHIGCEQGVCGMCTIIVDGVVVKSCLLLAAQLEGSVVQTVENLSDGNKLSDLQACLKKHHALQCGFCTPAILMVAKSLENQKRSFSRQEIIEEVSGVLCRCTGYEGIVKAIEDYLSKALKNSHQIQEDA